MPTVAPPEALDPTRRPFQPFGAAARLLYAKDPEVLLSGPAGTGKSRACLEKLHLCAQKYAGMRGLIVRKTRESLTESALVTFEEKVVPAGHPALMGPRRNARQSYIYPNGSVIVVGGLRQAGKDMTQKVMSTEYDLAYVQEAIELAEDEWEKVTTRLRNGVMPFQQIIADTNPDRPTHWLKQRCDTGRTLLLESRHEDNPTLWDARAKAWTPAGGSYLAKLDALTGPRKLRLRHGRWVQAEGVVYEGWDPALHLIDPFEVRKSWPRYLSVDFGFTNPMVVQWWAEDPDGRLYLYRELYQTRRLVEDVAREVVDLSAGEPRPRAVVCDHDAEDRATLQKHLRMDTVSARKEVRAGVQAVAARLRPAGDGRPRLFVFRDCLVRRDHLLVEVRKPCGLAEEIEGYVWDTRNNRKHGEEPLDADNHSMDAMRYLVMQADAGAGPVALPLDLVGNRPTPSAHPFFRYDQPRPYRL